MLQVFGSPVIACLNTGSAAERLQKLSDAEVWPSLVLPQGLHSPFLEIVRVKPVTHSALKTPLLHVCINVEQPEGIRELQQMQSKS